LLWRCEVIDQPNALRLADALEQQFPLGTAQHFLDGEAAAELRRLHQRVCDYEADAKAVMAEHCAGDEVHCSCVPHLRKGIKELHAENEALREALRTLVNDPVRYVGNRIEIDCESHGEAMQRIKTARAALEAARGKPCA
jgi:hypothetical protein